MGPQSGRCSSQRARLALSDLVHRYKHARLLRKTVCRFLWVDLLQPTPDYGSERPLPPNVCRLCVCQTRAQCISLFVCVRTVPSSVIHNTTRTSPIPVALAIPGSQRMTSQLPRVVNSNNACLSCPASEDHTTCRRPYVSIAHCWHQPTDALLSFSRFRFWLSDLLVANLIRRPAGRRRQSLLNRPLELKEF